MKTIRLFAVACAFMAVTGVSAQKMQTTKIAFPWNFMMEMAHYIRYGKWPDIVWGK